MSTLQKRSGTTFEARLSILFRDAVNFRLKLYELSKLRERVRRAELSARTSSEAAPFPFLHTAAGPTLPQAGGPLKSCEPSSGKVF